MTWSTRLRQLLTRMAGPTGSQPTARRRPALEGLEDRLTPSTVDLTTHGAVGAANGAIFRQFDAQPTGTGYINSFVRLQAQGAKTTVQQGYNTDARPVQFDENTSPQFTRSLRLSELPAVNIGGVQYRELLLDINQKASQPFLSLDELRVYAGGAPNLRGYSAATHQLAGLNAVYDLDGGGDNWVKLDARLNQGSGKGDMLFFVPESAFAGQGADPYVYVYSKFGVNYAGNAGFEEWAAGKSLLTCASGSISGTVFNGATQTGLPDVTVFLDTNGNGVLDTDETYTTTDANGFYSFSALATGLGTFTNYAVGIVSPPDALSTPSEVYVLLDYCGQHVTDVNFYITFNNVTPPPPPPPGDS